MDSLSWQEFVLTKPSYTAEEVKKWTREELSNNLFGELGSCQATPIGIYYGWFDEYVDMPSKSMPLNLFRIWDHLDGNDDVYHHCIEKERYEQEKKRFHEIIDNLKKQKALENN